MSYSSNDFSEDIVRCLVHAEVVEADATADRPMSRSPESSLLVAPRGLRVSSLSFSRAMNRALRSLQRVVTPSLTR
ncbi:hypothetical protein [Paraburkholderia sp. JHI869]|uniref:hypothetical protein n=1 Tax=Paraburkholderia sp. JHI869 TaxID=3112959 RepID=UPI00316F0AA1